MEKQFQEQVLEGVKSIQEKTAELTKNYDNLQKETKSAFEELTKVKNEFGSVADKVNAIEKVGVQMKREARMAFGDAKQRLLGDPEKVNAVMRSVFKAVGMPIPKALGEDSSPGSTLIQDEVATDIYDSLLSHGAWPTLGVRNLGTKLTKLPVKTARPVANFILTEGAEIADDTNKAGSSVNLEAEVIGVLLNVSRQLLDDASTDVAADVLNDFIEAVNERMDYAAFAATGTANGTHGGMTGIFSGGTAAVAPSGKTTVESLSYEHVLAALTTVDAAVLNRGAKWWMHPQIIARLLGIKDANGRPVFQTALEAPAYGSIGSLLGYPIIPVSAAPSSNAASAKVAVFGDPQACAVGVRKSFEFEVSDQARWTTYERSFRGITRGGVKIRKASALAVLTLAAS